MIRHDELEDHEIVDNNGTLLDFDLSLDYDNLSQQ